MKQINLKIEKNATESRTYIEFNSLIEFLKDESRRHMEMYKLWLDKAEETEDEKEQEELIKYEDAELERSCEIERLEYYINKQFIEFTKKVNENGFN